MKSRDLIKELKAERVVTTSSAGWHYQQAYRVTTYRAVEREDGALVWVSSSSSRRMSQPQLVREGYGDMLVGSLHNKPVTRQQATQIIGADGVAQLERNGWRFADTDAEVAA